MATSRSQSLFSDRSDAKSQVPGDYVSQSGSDEPVSSSASSQKSVNVKLLREIHETGGIREAVFDITQSAGFNNFILSLILINSVLVALENYEIYRRTYGWYFSIIDNVFLGIFIMESVVKIYSWRSAYFKSYWNVFDFCVVIISLATWIIPYVLVTFSVDVKIFRLFRLFRAVRAVRSLRALRAIRFFRSLQIILQTIVKSLPAISNILALAGIFLYVFAVIGTAIFRDVDPRRFGSLFRTIFCVFQIMAQDQWVNIYQENPTSALMYYYVVVVIIVMHFIFLNLFIAVFVNNLQVAKDKLRESRRGNKKIFGKSKESELDLFDKDNASKIDDDGAKKKASDDLFSEHLLEEQHGVENFYSPNLTKRQKELLSTYFGLLATVEMNQRLHERQRKVLDDLVDLSKVGPST